MVGFDFEASRDVRAHFAPGEADVLDARISVITYPDCAGTPNGIPPQVKTC